MEQKIVRRKKRYVFNVERNKQDNTENPYRPSFKPRPKPKKKAKQPPPQPKKKAKKPYTPPKRKISQEENHYRDAINAYNAWQVRVAKMKQCFLMLRMTFPKAFDEPKPLEIDFHKKVIATIGEAHKREIRLAIDYWCKSKEYLQSIIDHTHRFDLEGNQVAEILDEAKEDAKQRLARKIKKTEDRKAFLEKARAFMAQLPDKQS